MKPTLDQIMASVNYLPWKTVGKLNGVPYLDLLTDLGIGVMEAAVSKSNYFCWSGKGRLRCSAWSRRTVRISSRYGPGHIPPHRKRSTPKREGFGNIGARFSRSAGIQRQADR